MFPDCSDNFSQDQRGRGMDEWQYIDLSKERAVMTMIKDKFVHLPKM